MLVNFGGTSFVNKDGADYFLGPAREISLMGREDKCLFIFHLRSSAKRRHLRC